MRIDPGRVAAGGALGAGGAGVVGRGGAAGELTETERIHHLLNRFAYGPTPELVAAVRQQGITQWFEDQITHRHEEPDYLKGRLADMKSLGLTNQEVLLAYRDSEPGKRGLRNLPARELKDSILLRDIYGANPVKEVLSDFFRNHFNVDLNKNNVRYLATEYDREVIRRHVFDSFGAMLMASAKHPAMLVFLDNALSRRPPSEQELREIGRRVKRKTGSKSRALESVEIARQRGLNENYARELLELHTLGVDNGYTQKDVIEVAKALTGWTVQNNPEQPVTFKFRPEMHAEGDRRVLKGVIQKDRDSPVTEGERVLKRILKHPGTAHFICWKLCRYFVDDHPPRKMVDRVAGVFAGTKGDLPSVYRAIVADPEYFSRRFVLSKFKRPLEFLVSALRVTAADVTSTRVLQATLKALNEPIYECEDPTGYFDQAEAWNDPGVMAQRWRFAMDLVQGKVRGARILPSFYEDLHLPVPMAWKSQIGRKVLSARMTRHTSEVIDRMVRKELPKSKGDKRSQRNHVAPLVLGMLLGSPEFQRQ